MTHFGFELLRDEHIDELDTRARLFRHQKTGAELLSLENEDENKVFGITFRTPPSDSTGVPHIMEHSVLCGSRKYPLKEPFIELVKGSLNTFLNAMTYPDKTTYPVASQNLQDFYNLVDVYLDAVLFPLIPEHTLQQEGWHFELEQVDQPLMYKGVVFNEMKGVYSSPDNLLYRYTQQMLYPDITYGVDSGGDPSKIPDLSYAQFKAFHETYYHPSNARLYFYGDDPWERRLEQAAQYLDLFERQEVDSQIGLQSRFESPRHYTFSYEAGDQEKPGQKSMMTMSWLLPEKSDTTQTMLLGLLSYILVSTPASPLRKALLDSGLGEELTGGGLAAHLRQMYFSTGLKGIDEADCAKVEELILKTLARIAEEGIETEMLEAAINTTEFHLRENNTGSYPRGLSLMLRAMGMWLHDRDPLAPLRYEAPLAAVKELLAKDSAPLQALIREHLLDNPHRITVLLNPAKGVQKQQEEAEAARLKAAREQMDQGQLAEIVEQTATLKKLQETPDSPELLATLPSLTLADLDSHNKTIPIAVESHGTAEILYHDLFTNGIIYLDLGFDLGGLPQEWLPYTGLFGRALVEIGTETEDEVKLAQRIRRKTGGLWPSTFTGARRDGGSEASTQNVNKFFLRAKVTADKMDDLLDIMRDVMLTAKFDNQDKMRQFVRKSKANMEASLVPSGQSYVNTRLRARLGGPDQIVEHTGGVNKLFFLRDLVEKIENDFPSVLSTLEQMRHRIINRRTALCNVTTDADTWQRFAPKLKALLDSLPEEKPTSHTWNFAMSPLHEGLALPTQVNFVGKGANLYDLGYSLHGSVSVISNFLRTTWLWEKVRMQGGAYGGMCRFSRRTGHFSFLSYRDPNLLGTLENYDKASAYLRKIELSERELTRNIIGTIGDIDGYQLPDAKGYSSMVHHLTGETDEYRQALREQILSTQASHFRQFGELLEAFNEKALVVVMGSPDALAKANQELPHKLAIQTLM